MVVQQFAMRFGEPAVVLSVGSLNTLLLMHSEFESQGTTSATKPFSHLALGRPSRFLVADIVALFCGVLLPKQRIFSI
jgi:hypothetical protein